MQGHPSAASGQAATYGSVPAAYSNPFAAQAPTASQAYSASMHSSQPAASGWHPSLLQPVRSCNQC